jgi:hypothetical protein
MGYSINGTGLTVLGYTPMGDGLYRVSLWITFFFIPIMPIFSRVVRPSGSGGSGLGGDQFFFEVIRCERLHLIDVIRIYALGWGLAVLGLAPAVAMVLYSKQRWPHGGGPWWSFPVLVLCVVWPVFILGVLNHRQHTIHAARARGRQAREGEQ